MVDESTGIAGVLHVVVAFQIAFHIVCHVCEVLIRVNIELTCGLQYVGGCLDSVHIEVQMALFVHGDVEALLAVVGLRFARHIFDLIIQCRQETELESAAVETHSGVEAVLTGTGTCRAC